MKFEVFRAGTRTLVRITPGREEYNSRPDRWIEIEAEHMKMVDATLSTSKPAKYLAFFNGKEPVGIIKDREWDFVIPENSEVIYNDHG